MSEDDKSAEEQAEAQERRSISAKTVHEAILIEGKEELERSSAALAWSGLAAGLSMGFSLALEGVLRAHLPQTQWTPLITKLGYPLGFLFVTLGRQQLFTETTLIATLPVFHDVKKLGNLLRLWTIVLVANLVGALLFALAAAHTGIFSSEVRAAFSTIGQEAIGHPFWDDLVKGIFGGWLVALMVWLLPGADTARFPTIVVTTYVLAVSELTHIIAGSVETLFLVLRGEATLMAYFTGFMIPVLIGNTIGGVVFVAALNHAQAVGGKKKEGT